METFYENGLKFQCQQCSSCCRHDSGYVFLSKEDLLLLCQSKQLSEAEFLTTYCSTVIIDEEIRISLLEKANYDCIFWDEALGGCAVYAGRPLQCRNYPFWPSMLNHETWQKSKMDCPGLDCGALYTKEKIEDLLALRRQQPLITLKNRK